MTLTDNQAHTILTALKGVETTIKEHEECSPLGVPLVLHELLKELKVQHQQALYAMTQADGDFVRAFDLITEAQT